MNFYRGRCVCSTDWKCTWVAAFNSPCPGFYLKSYSKASYAARLTLRITNQCVQFCDSRIQFAKALCCICLWLTALHPLYIYAYGHYLLDVTMQAKWSMKCSEAIGILDDSAKYIYETHENDVALRQQAQKVLRVFIFGNTSHHPLNSSFLSWWKTHLGDENVSGHK